MRTREQLHEARRKIRRERVAGPEETSLRTVLRIIEAETPVSSERSESRTAEAVDSVWIRTIQKTTLLSDAEWQKTWRTLPDPVLAARQTTQWASNARLSVFCCTDAVDAVLDRYGTWRERYSTDDDSFFVFSPASPRERQSPGENTERAAVAAQAFGYAFGNADGMYRHGHPRYGGLTARWAGDNRGWCTEAGGPVPTTYTKEPENPSFGDVWNRPSGERLVFDDDAWSVIGAGAQS